jgi:hypothetical protein
MKTSIQRKASYILCALLLAAGLQAQVVIGSLGNPERAALLQIKDKEANPAGGATATTGGLLLPRVSLIHASDITVISTNVTTAKKEALTGLLVYNVNTSGELDEGIYEWDGSAWNLLETVSEIAGSSTQKSVVRVATLAENNVPSVSMGIFQFSIDPTTKRPRYKLTSDPLGSVTFWHNVTRNWVASNHTEGVSYDAMSKTFATSNYTTWQYFHTPNPEQPDFRYDIWLVDHVNNHAYNVQVLGATTGLATPIHAVLVTEY